MAFLAGLQASAPLISAGSSLLGTLGGLFGKKKKGPDMYEQLQAQRWHQSIIDRNRPSDLLQGAKSAGVHPLTVLGMNPSHAGYSQQVGDTGNDVFGSLANMGQDVSRAISAYQTKEQREEARLLSVLGLERAGLENELLRSQIAGQRAQLAPALSSAISGDDPRYPKQKDMPLGIGDTSPLWRMAINEKGERIRVYNDDLGDNELMQIATSPVTALDWLRNSFKSMNSFHRQQARRQTVIHNQKRRHNWARVDKTYGRENRPWYAKNY